MSDTDDRDLMARLRAADPAADLTPADPGRVERLLEDAMSNDVRAPETRTGRRNPLTWVVAAAAAIIIAGVGFFAIRGQGDSGTPVAHETVTQLTASSAPARCMVPTVDRLSGRAVAFRGTVESLTGDAVTLRVTHWYNGGPTSLVKVAAPAPALRALVGAVHFHEGGDYLVTATDGQVTACGFSGPATAARTHLYEQAFSG